ncbi:DHH phosphoesterase [Meredithblackwellia eburnea MCA 4105]
MPAPTSTPLSSYLRSAKAAFLNELKQGKPLDKWVLCMGNEAGDLDSVASAIGFAYFSSATSQGSSPSKSYVPLVQTARSDLYLRPENVDVLRSSHIDDDDLLCINDIQPSVVSSQGTTYALVDHNKLLPSFASTSQQASQVHALIDHHADEGFHKSADPRIIQPVGSCSSLVTNHFNSPSIPAPLADLLIAAILIDTGLKPASDGGKALPQDIDAFSILSRFSTFPSSTPLSSAAVSPLTEPKDAWVKEKASLLAQIKANVKHLSGRDLLRRDYKQYQIATIPLPLSSWLEKAGSTSTKEDQWALVKSDVEAYAKEHDLSLLMGLTSFDTGDKSVKKGGLGKHAREQLVYISDSKLAPLFDDLGRDPTLRLGSWRGGEVPLDAKTWRVWQQGNERATRKQVAPVVKEIVENILQQSNL